MPSPDKHRSISAPPPHEGFAEHSSRGYHPQANYPNQVEHAKKSRSGKGIPVQVHFLDDSNTGFRVQFKALGKWLFEQVCQMLNLIEVDYFGLEYYDANQTRYWLDMEKPIYRQLSLNLESPQMFFGVKFYTPDPSKLEDELTRYLFSLQVKRDLAQGTLHCNENTAALIASYVIQAEIGDYCPEEYNDQSYLAQFALVPHQDSAFEWKTMENHKRHVGQSPAEADLNLLETARRCECYGVKLTPVKDQEGVPLSLSSTHAGVVVFQNFTKVDTFIWSKIRKLSFKRKKFLVKLHQAEPGPELVEYVFETRNECKNFWKKCIEQHTFFRCTESRAAEKAKAKIFSRGSSFRYSGRTQQQVVEHVRNSLVKRQPFHRSCSFRTSSASGRRMEGSGSVHQSFPVSTPNLDAFDGTDHDDHQTLTMQQRSQSAQGYRQELHQPLSEGISLASPSSHHERLTEETEEDLEQEDQAKTGTFPSETHLPAYSMTSVAQSASQRCEPVRSEQEKTSYVLKELLMLSRTFFKDLQIISVWFKEVIECEPCNLPSEVLSLLFSSIDPLLELHERFLNNLEMRLQSWSLPTNEMKFGCADFKELITPILHSLPLYDTLIERLPFVVDRLNASFRFNRKFETICREFEAHRGCYLPFTSFIIKPAYHVCSFMDIYENLVKFVDLETEAEESECVDLLEHVNQFLCDNDSTLDALLNTIYLIELQRDISGVDNVVRRDRKFIRQGCLQKLSKKGYQQRIFFLFNDLLIYCSRSSSSANQFKVHGSLPLENVMIEETEAKSAGKFCFTIYGGDRALMVAANCDKERQIWMGDIQSADSHSPTSRDTLDVDHLADELLDQMDSALSGVALEPLAPSASALGAQMRSNTMAHVCWHRNCSIGINEYKAAFATCLSGYLLRKFKNSSGWQKLWVVFTNFCLFFYKSYQEEFPLASLPLLGYELSLPSDEDEDLNKNNVFKLHFKTHVYYFRAENEYSFLRWMDALRTASMQ